MIIMEDTVRMTEAKHVCLFDEERKIGRASNVWHGYETSETARTFMAMT